MVFVELFDSFGVSGCKILFLCFSELLDSLYLSPLHKAAAAIVNSIGFPHSDESDKFLMGVFCPLQCLFMPLLSDISLEPCLDHGGAQMHELQHLLLIVTPLLLLKQLLVGPFPVWVRDDDSLGLTFERLD